MPSLVDGRILEAGFKPVSVHTGTTVCIG